MRLTHLLALTAVAGAATGTAGAQDSRATTETRTRTSPAMIWRTQGEPDQ